MPHTSPALVSLEEWIARDAIPFSLDAPGSLNEAVDRMVAALGDSVRMLGFGEALHGGEEILLFRNRLFQRLAEAHGYTAIAIESSFPRGGIVDEFITGRGPESYAEVRETGFSHGFGALAANRELVEWMRGYNADAAHSPPLHFYGFDLPAATDGPASPHAVLDFVLDYLDALAPTVAREHRERIDALMLPDSDWENPMPWMSPEASEPLLSTVAALRLETEELISTLHTRRPEWVCASDAARHAEAWHYAGVARQFLTFFVALARGSDYGASLGVRDALMGDNLAYIAARERDRGKVLVFAHNKHVQRGRAEFQMGPARCTWWPAGAHLHQRLGSGYAVVGSAVGVSEENGIPQPESGTLEALLAAAPGPNRFIATHGGHHLPPSALAELPLRTGSAKNPSYCALSPQSFTDFDGWVTFDSVTYPRGARPLP